MVTAKKKFVPLTRLKGCGKLFYQPRYVVRWQIGKSRKELEYMMEQESQVCGEYFGGKGFYPRQRAKVILCEECLKATGIVLYGRLR